MQTFNEVLKQRAKEAAKTIEIEVMDDAVDVICFRMGSEVYAVEDKFVHEVYPYLQPTKVPCTPSFIMGIINLRGAFVSVVDLEHILGLQQNQSKKDGFILLLANEKIEFGIVVDEILDEIKISKKSIQDLPEGLNILTKELIDGVTSDGVIMIDGKSFLEDSKLVVYEEIN